MCDGHSEPAQTAREWFLSLPQSEQDDFLDKHRRWNVDHINWWDCIYEQFEEDMKEKGIEIDHRRNRVCIYFSGFGSQGDGACFEGRVQDFMKVLPEKSVLREYHDRVDGWEIYWTSHGNYCHEHSLRFTDSFDVLSFAGDSELHRAAYAQLEEELQDAWNVFVDEFAETVRAYCGDLYIRLEEEYDYLTSDECLIETLDANQMFEEFREEYENEYESA